MPRLDDATRMVFTQEVSKELAKIGVTGRGLKVFRKDLVGKFSSPMLVSIVAIIREKFAQAPLGTNFVMLTRKDVLRAMKPTIDNASRKTAEAIHRRVNESAILRSPRHRQEPEVDIAGILGLGGAEVTDVNEGAQAFGQDVEYGGAAFGEEPTSSTLFRRQLSPEEALVVLLERGGESAEERQAALLERRAEGLERRESWLTKLGKFFEPIVRPASVAGLGQDVEYGGAAFGQDVEYGGAAFDIAGVLGLPGAEVTDVNEGAQAFGQDIEYAASAFGQIGIEQEPFVEF